MDSSAIEIGATLLRYGERGRTLKPQQYQVGAALDEQRAMTAVLMPRRSAKTESVLLWTIGLCASRPNTRVAFTMATTRQAARDKFMADVYPMLLELEGMGAHVLRGAGSERAEFEDGSSLRIVAPNEKAFRSQAFDIIIVDEAQASLEGDEADDLLGAMLPTLDTSELGMLILMGTAGEYREGNLLWDALHDPDAAVVDYSLGDHLDESMLTDWEYVSAALEVNHPGVGTLTTLDRLKRNWRSLSPVRFAREYLGLWGTRSGSGGMFDGAVVGAATLPGDLPRPPRRFALALHADTTGRWAIVAAWRVDDAGHVLLLDHGDQVAGAAPRARDLARKYRVPVAIDGWAHPVMMDVKQRLEQLRPSPNLTLQTVHDLGAAYERFSDDMLRGLVHLYEQDHMVTALLRVKRVQMGKYWKMSGLDVGDDATPAVAAAIALRQYDAAPASPMAGAQHAVVNL